MKSIFDTLKERELIAQTTHEEEIRKILDEEKITFYIGFDATAESLHVGHLVQIMTIKHLQNSGHVPIILIGGGTTLIGDPTGRIESRPMKEEDEIGEYVKKFEELFKKFIDFDENKARIVNNASWLKDLSYVKFLRDIGVHFSINKMLSAECFKTRLETGLSFLEFNYMLMQGYDFYHLNQNYNCVLQLGGNDQWSNIIAGIELNRRKSGKETYGMTINLLTTKEGKKMGKTEKGAIWIDGKKTTSFDFYQFFRNLPDDCIVRMLKMLTFIPLEQISKYEKLQGSEINEAKILLADNLTNFIYGEDESAKVFTMAKSVFCDHNFENMQNVEVILENDVLLVDFLVMVELCGSKNEARRLIQQSGISFDGKSVDDISYVVKKEAAERTVIIKKGKKTFLKVLIK